MRKVIKYGGSSLASVEQILAVGEYIASLEGEIIVVVSAMGDTTDKLLGMAEKIGTQNKRETDALLSTGEICSAALVAMAVEKAGKKAVSLSGVRTGIITNNIHGNAEIIRIDKTSIEDELKMGKTVIIAGFQGVAETGEITTLGRNGSDTSAVALAAEMECPCEIYTDVEGVFTEDPRTNPDAEKLHFITYHDMIEKAEKGAQVVSLSAIRMVEKNAVPLYVGKALEKKKQGTCVGFRKVNAAVVGASGLVGSTFLKIMDEYNFPLGEIYLYGKTTVGKVVDIMAKTVIIEELNEENIKGRGIDYAFLFAGGEVSREYTEILHKMGITVIDNSSVWRMERDIPLVVPEVNGNILKGDEKLISNPNCSTIQCAIPLSILNDKYTVKEINFTSFQAVSGSGMRGITELERTRNGENALLYPYSIAQNCIPQIGNVKHNGYTDEELKMINETRKILGNDNIRITATCVRVPVAECHGVDICVTLEKDFDINEIKAELSRRNCIIMGNNCPVNEMARGTDKVYIGRIRRHIGDEKTLHLWCVADNVRRGAAYNAFEIMRLMERRKYEALWMPDRPCDTI